jgi:hypothetical protein
MSPLSTAFLACAVFAAQLATAASLELVSVDRIWDKAPHNAFGDLIRFQNRWFAVCREGKGHVASRGEEDDGKLRVITSSDGARWDSAALVSEPGIDLRDPHLSITADHRLMIVAGGSEYPGGKYKTRQPRVMFSKDGREWTAPQRVLSQGEWLWRVTWHDGKAYGVSKYGSPGKELPEDPRRVDLVTSSDGVHWEKIAELGVTGGDETTIRFLHDGTMVALMRRRTQTELSANASIGVSKPPYKQWKWTETKHFIGGPNFIVLPNGRMIAGGRNCPTSSSASCRMMLGPMTTSSYQPELQLPSQEGSGDNSYPGFAFDNGLLWVSYYAPYGSGTAMYLAKVRVSE